MTYELCFQVHVTLRLLRLSLMCFNVLYLVRFNLNKTLKTASDHCWPLWVFATTVHLQHVFKALQLQPITINQIYERVRKQSLWSQQRCEWEHEADDQEYISHRALDGLSHLPCIRREAREEWGGGRRLSTCPLPLGCPKCPFIEAFIYWYMYFNVRVASCLCPSTITFNY